jgi:signal transduction histidine kinase
MAPEEGAERSTRMDVSDRIDALADRLERRAAEDWAASGIERGTRHFTTGTSGDLLDEAMLLERAVRLTLRTTEAEVAPDELGLFYEEVQGLLREPLYRATQAQEREARRKRAEYLSFLGHELASPLHAIRMSLERLHVRGAEDERIKTIVLHATERLVELVQRVVDFERLTAEEVGLRLEIIKPSDVLEAALAEVELLASSKNLRIFLVVERGITMYADRRLVHDAVVNVLRNAVSYCDSGSITVGIDEIDGGVRFSIRDTGPGIPKEKQLEIFQPFRRLASKKPGSGLGLAIAKQAVEAQQGAITVESSPGEGACFSIWIPRQVSEEERPVRPGERGCFIVRSVDRIGAPSSVVREVARVGEA